MVPEGWSVCKYSDVADINARTLGTNTPPDYKMQYVDIASIETTGIIKSVNNIVYENAPSRARRVVQSGDILVSTVRPYLRSFAYIEEAPDNMVASTGYAVLSAKAEIDPQYLYQTILSDKFINSLELKMKGSNYPAVNAKDVADSQLSVPPLPEQNKIAEILSSVDAAIAKTQEVIDQTKKVKDGLLRELLTRGIGHTKFKKSEIGEIPEGWEVSTLNELSKEKGQYGANAPKENFNPEYPRYIRITDINDTGTLNDDPVSLNPEKATKYLLKDGDFLFARSGATVGKTFLYENKYGKCAYAGYLIRFRLKEDRLLPQLLKFFTESPIYFRWLKEVQRAMAQPNINATEYGNMLIPVPPTTEQAEMVAILKSYDLNLSNFKFMHQQLSRIKQGLLQDLLTGKVRVTP